MQGFDSTKPILRRDEDESNAGGLIITYYGNLYLLVNKNSKFPQDEHEPIGLREEVNEFVAKNPWLVRPEHEPDPPEPEPEPEPETIEPPQITLEEVKENAIAETRLILSQILEVPINFNENQYTVTLEKQNLLFARLELFKLNTDAGIYSPLLWNATGQTSERWEFKDLLALTNAIVAHVDPLAEKQRQAEVDITKAKSKRAVSGVLEQFRSDLGIVVARQVKKIK